MRKGFAKSFRIIFMLKYKIINIHQRIKTQHIVVLLRFWNLPMLLYHKNVVRVKEFFVRGAVADLQKSKWLLLTAAIAGIPSNNIPEFFYPQCRSALSAVLTGI